MSATETTPEAPDTESKPRVIKVLVWDLDHTLWNGTLVEGDDLQLRDGVVETIKTLDERGILQSIASKNDHEHAKEALERFGLWEYFLYPQISWNAKSAGIAKIKESINVGMDAIAFIDDQPFEREEVGHQESEVLLYDAEELDGLLERPELMPRFITDESAIRRKMYAADIARNDAEGDFVGPQEDFLAELDMKFVIGPCRQEDLRRAEELTVRTNQLNATGYTYDYDELDAFRKSDDHLLLVASLDDKYGTYGKIGLALVEKGSDTEGPVWTLKLMLMSCRVMSRGVGTIFLNHILTLAQAAGARFHAELKHTGRNRLMIVTYKFAGFKEVSENEDGIKVLEADYSRIQPFPDYVDVVIES